jgi:hypothetical protein
MKAAIGVVVLAGCIAGIASAVLSTTYLAQHRHEEVSVARAEPAEAKASTWQPSTAPLPSAPPSPAGSAIDAPARVLVEAPRGETVDIAAAAKEQEDRHRQLLEAHRRDPVDKVWAQKARAEFSADLESLEKTLPIHVDNVDCRTTSCTANVTFGTYAAARESFDKILTHAYAKGNECGTEITLMPPTSPDGKYSTEVYFDCDRVN